MSCLTEEDHKLISDCKNSGFEAFLQGNFLISEWLQGKIKSGESVSKEKLQEIFERTKKRKLNFDFIYLGFLALETSHPLKLEQRAWQLISPIAKSFLSDFEAFLQNYSGDEKDCPKVADFLERFRGILVKWNILSNSYRPKLWNAFDKIEQAEKELQAMIDRLS